MKKYIISKLKKRGLNSNGENNINDFFSLISFLFKLILIPLVMIGIFSLGIIFSELIKIILNF